MKAIISDSVEETFMDFFKKNIRHKYPSASIECFGEPDILSVDPADECIIVVLEERLINDEFISYIRDAYHNLEHLLCLVDQKNYEQYQRLYGSICKVFPKNKHEIQKWFDNLIGEPKIIKSKEEEGHVNNMLDRNTLNENGIDLDEAENSKNPDLEDLDLNDLLELPNIDLSLEESSLDLEPEKEGQSEENLLSNLELFIEDNELNSKDSLSSVEYAEVEVPTEKFSDELPLEGIEISSNESGNPNLDKSLGLVDTEFDNQGLVDPLQVDESENPDLVDSTNLQKNSTEISSGSEEVSVPLIEEESPVLIEKQIQQRKYEEKVIALRDSLDIPVWKKRKLESKTVGIWSPLHRIGVTTLTINLALYFAQLSIPVAVLEGVTKNIKMKSLLSKYDKKNASLFSYNAYLNNESISATQVVWKYRNVHFFPFDENDVRSRWDNERIKGFINGLKFHDVLLLDLPTGEMAPYTLDSLEYIDELWIVINNDILSIAEWKEYIHSVLQPRVPIYLIFNEEFTFSKPKKISEALGFPLITSIPALHEVVALNQYDSIPLIEQEGVADKIEKSFLQILQHLVGEEIKVQKKGESEKRTLNQIMKRLKLW